MEAAAALCSGRTLHGHGIAELASCYGSICAKITLSAEPIIIIFVILAFSLWLGVRCLVPAMARCDLAPCCSPEKAARPRPHFAAAAPSPLFRGAAGRSPPPTQTIPPLAQCALLVSCYGSVRKRPVLLPQTAEGGLVLVRKRPFPSPPSAVWGAGRCVPSAPPSGGGRGQAGARPLAAVHQPAPFRRRCPCSPPRGASLLICFFNFNRCSLLFFSAMARYKKLVLWLR